MLNKELATVYLLAQSGDTLANPHQLGHAYIHINTYIAIDYTLSEVDMCVCAMFELLILKLSITLRMIVISVQQYS